MNIKLIAMLALLATTGIVHAAGDATAGKTKSVACQGCHGADGNSFNNQWPKLAGQHAEYLTKQLNDFKSGARQDPTMTAMAAPLTPEDIADISAYFSGQTVRIAGATEEGVAAGEKLFRGGNKETGVPACMGCHGPSGAGNPGARFPAIGGQHAVYTEKALHDFRDGKRKNDQNSMMQGVVARMTDAEIKAVANYISGLH